MSVLNTKYCVRYNTMRASILCAPECIRCAVCLMRSLIICRFECEMICPKWIMWLVGCTVSHIPRCSCCLLSHYLCPSSGMCVNVLAVHTACHPNIYTCMSNMLRSIAMSGYSWHIFLFCRVGYYPALSILYILNAYIIIACNLMKYIICVHKYIPNIN